VVSPRSMLYTVWDIIPFFRGYSQQDAQEFLSYAALIFIFACFFCTQSLNFKNGVHFQDQVHSDHTKQLLGGPDSVHETLQDGRSMQFCLAVRFYY